MESILAGSAVLGWIALLLVVTRIVTHPPRWWIRRQAARRRAAELQAYRATLRRLSTAVTELGDQFAIAYTPVIAAVANITEQLAQAIEESHQ